MTTRGTSPVTTPSSPSLFGRLSSSVSSKLGITDAAIDISAKTTENVINKACQIPDENLLSIQSLLKANKKEEALEALEKLEQAQLGSINRTELISSLKNNPSSAYTALDQVVSSQKGHLVKVVELFEKLATKEGGTIDQLTDKLTRNISQSLCNQPDPLILLLQDDLEESCTRYDEGLDKLPCFTRAQNTVSELSKKYSNTQNRRLWKFHPEIKLIQKHLSYQKSEADRPHHIKHVSSPDDGFSLDKLEGSAVTAPFNALSILQGHGPSSIEKSAFISPQAKTNFEEKKDEREGIKSGALDHIPHLNSVKKALATTTKIAREQTGLVPELTETITSSFKKNISEMWRSKKAQKEVSFASSTTPLLKQSSSTQEIFLQSSNAQLEKDLDADINKHKELVKTQLCNIFILKATLPSRTVLSSSHLELDRLHLKTAIFEELDQNKRISSLKRWAAKAHFFLARPFIEFYVPATIENVVKACQKKLSDSSMEASVTNVLTVLNDHLSSINNAFLKIKKAPQTINGRLEELVYHELQKSLLGSPEKKQNVYKKVVEKFIADFIPPFSLLNFFKKNFSSFLFPSSSMFSFINVVLKPVTTALAYLSYAALYLPLVVVDKSAKLYLKRKILNSLPKEGLLSSIEKVAKKDFAFLINHFLLKALETSIEKEKNTQKSLSPQEEVYEISRRHSNLVKELTCLLLKGLENQKIKDISTFLDDSRDFERDKSSLIDFLIGDKIRENLERALSVFIAKQMQNHEILKELLSQTLLFVSSEIKTPPLIVSVSEKIQVDAKLSHLIDTTISCKIQEEAAVFNSQERAQFGIDLNPFKKYAEESISKEIQNKAQCLPEFLSNKQYLESLLNRILMNYAQMNNF